MGSGFRTFQSGEVLTASNVQNFLMEQSVMTFAGTAALGSAIGTAVEAGMVAYLTDSDQIIHYRADAVQGTAWQAMPMVGVPANVVINGAMQVAQRGTSTTGITASGYWTADRWNLDIGSLGTWTQTVENDAPTGSGLRKSLKMTCTTADASPAAGDFMLLQTLLEGQNVQQFLKGTSSAKEFTMSFWVKGTTTGTYVVSLYDNDNARNVGRTYTINAANTWEKKTITFPADTTGAFDNDNAQSLRIWFGLGLGTNFTSGTLPATWASYSAANSFAGQTVNLAGATSRSWQITGVQLEAGSVATPFEFEDYGTTFAKCQRYYQRFTGGSIASYYAIGNSSSTTAGFVLLNLITTMRVEPTSIEYSALRATDIVSNFALTGVAIESAASGPETVLLALTGLTGMTQYRTLYLQNDSNAAGYVALSAEL